MIYRKQLKAPLILMSILLLMSQFAVLKHSVEHLFHAPSQACQVFIHYDKNSAGLKSPILQTPLVIHSSVIFLTSIFIGMPLITFIWHPARAPPISA